MTMDMLHKSNTILWFCFCSIKTVLLGMHSIKKEKIEKKYRQVRKVKTSVPHCEFDKNKRVNDLMLLKVR